MKSTSNVRVHHHPQLRLNFKMRSALFLLGVSGLANAVCPYMDANEGVYKRSDSSEAQVNGMQTDAGFLNQFTVNDSYSFITSDAGGPIQDNTSLKAGNRGPTLLEDFIFRQKIQHFDHERVRLELTATTSVQVLLLDYSIDWSIRYPNVLFMLEVLVSTRISY